MCESRVRVVKVVVSSIVCVSNGVFGVRNCGNRVVKNRMVLGLVIVMFSYCRKSWFGVCGGLVEVVWVFSCSGVLCYCWMLR